MSKKTVKITLRERFTSGGVTVNAYVYHGGSTAHISLAKYEKARRELGVAIGEGLTFARRNSEILEVFVWDPRDKSGNPCMCL